MTEWFKIGKGVRQCVLILSETLALYKSFTYLLTYLQGCILSPWLFNLYAEAAMKEALDGYNKGFQIRGRVINNLRYADNMVLIV